MKYDRHLFVCINQRTDGRKSCGEEHGLQLVKRCKELMVEYGLKGKIRVNKAGCLDACSYGPSMVVYPEGIWYGALTMEKAERIMLEHIRDGKPVKEYIIDFNMLASKWLETQQSRTFD